MNGKMPTQDQVKLRLEMNSNRGIESFKKTSMKNFDCFTPSPLKREAYHIGCNKTGNIESTSCVFTVKEQDQFIIEDENEGSINHKNSNEFQSCYIGQKNPNCEGVKKNANFFEQLSANLDDLANLELNLNHNSKNIINKTDNREKHSSESSMNNTNANLSLTNNKSVSFSNNSHFNSVNKASSNLSNFANVNTTSHTNIGNNNNNNKHKDKEKAEEAAPLTSNLKNFLENYDDLLGMIGSNSKASTMTSNFSNDSNNINSIYRSILDNESGLKQDLKSKTIKIPNTIKYPSNFSSILNEEEDPQNAKKFKFATSFKSKKSAEIYGSSFKNSRSSADCIQTRSISFKKTNSDMAIPQCKLRNKNLESNILRFNPINPILEEDKVSIVHPGNSKGENSKQTNKEGNFTILSNTNSDEEDEDEEESDAEYNFRRRHTQDGPKVKKVQLNESLNGEENNKDSLIMLNPIIAKVTITENKVHLDSLVTCQIRKPNPQGTTLEDRNLEETKLVQNLTNQEDIKDFYEYTEECLKRIIQLKTPTLEEIQDLLFSLPFEDDLKTKKLAIFDLDETLIHCEIKKPQKGQVQIMVNLPSGDTAKIGLNIRPYWRECLQELSKYYLIIVYTASHQSYADSVLDYLDPDKELIKYRLYRHNCVRVKMESEFIYVKDLRIFKNVKMEDMIIIDNSVLSFAFQLENGIPILPFYDNQEDIELKFLANYLGSIHNVKDLRVENNRSIKMLYFLNAVQEKEKIEEDKESNNNCFNIKLLNSNNEEENNSSYVSDPEGLNGSELKKESNNKNSNSMFKISLFSAEGNNMNNNNQNDVSQMSDNNEASFSNSESSHNDSYNFNSNTGDITNKFFNFNNNNNNINFNSNNFTNLRNGENSKNVNKNKTHENSISEGNSEIKGKKGNKRNNTFQDKLFSTLDDLKKTFTKLSEKRTSIMFSNNNNI